MKIKVTKEQFDQIYSCESCDCGDCVDCEDIEMCEKIAEVKVGDTIAIVEDVEISEASRKVDIEVENDAIKL